QLIIPYEELWARTEAKLGTMPYPVGLRAQLQAMKLAASIINWRYADTLMQYIDAMETIGRNDCAGARKNLEAVARETYKYLPDLAALMNAHCMRKSGAVQ